MCAETSNNTFGNNEQQKLWMANGNMAAEYDKSTNSTEMKVRGENNKGTD